MLEPQIRLHRAQAQSNWVPKGRKADARDAEQLRKLFVAGEPMLNFVPDVGQRAWRMITCARLSLMRERVQVRNRMESLLEEAAFPTPVQMASRTGVCSGSQQRAGRNASGRLAKSNPNLRRVLNQAAHAAVHTQGSSFAHLFRRLVVRLSYAKALRAVAHKHFRILWKIRVPIPSSAAISPDSRTAQRRIQHRLRMLRKPGCSRPAQPLSCNLMGRHFRGSGERCRGCIGGSEGPPFASSLDVQPH